MVTIKLSRAKRTLETTFSTESWSELEVDCEDDKVQVNHLEIIYHLPKFQSHVLIVINITFSNMCQMLMTLPK
jgi:hypothetical protein